VPKMPASNTKQLLKKKLCRIYQCNEKQHGDDFLSRIITGDKAHA
jgi:hypothetical protein